MTFADLLLSGSSSLLTRSGPCASRSSLYSQRGICVRAVSDGANPLFTIPAPPLPPLVAVVERKHVAVIEKRGAYSKTIESGVHALIPFLERIAAVVKTEYQIPVVEGYEIGGTIKLKIINMVSCYRDEAFFKLAMDNAKVVIEEMISNSFREGGVVEEDFNKLVEDKLNELAKNSIYDYSVELDMQYVEPLSHMEAIERAKEKMKQEERAEEKREEKREDEIMKIIDKALTAVVLLLLLRRVT